MGMRQTIAMHRARPPRHLLRIVPLLALILGASALGAALPGGGVAAVGAAPSSISVPPITPCSVINQRKIIITRTSIGIQGAVTTKYWRTSQWATTLLDPMYRISSSYRPTNLVAITWRGVINPNGGRRPILVQPHYVPDAIANNLGITVVGLWDATNRQIVVQTTAAANLAAGAAPNR